MTRYGHPTEALSAGEIMQRAGVTNMLEGRQLRLNTFAKEERAMTKYRRRSEEVEAFQWTGNADPASWPEWLRTLVEKGRIAIEEGRPFPMLLIHDSTDALHGFDLPNGTWIVRCCDGITSIYTRESFDKYYEPIPEELE